jgi:hypothetical protein
MYFTQFATALAAVVILPVYAIPVLEERATSGMQALRAHNIPCRILADR